MRDLAETGIARVRSRFSVAETVERLRGVLAAKGITLFALIDHSGEAAKVGLAIVPRRPNSSVMPSYLLEGALIAACSRWRLP